VFYSDRMNFADCTVWHPVYNLSDGVVLLSTAPHQARRQRSSRTGGQVGPDRRVSDRHLWWNRAA
jgi:hypothetical protein